MIQVLFYIKAFILNGFLQLFLYKLMANSMLLVHCAVMTDILVYIPCMREYLHKKRPVSDASKIL